MELILNEMKLFHTLEVSARNTSKFKTSCLEISNEVKKSFFFGDNETNKKWSYKNDDNELQ